jgi:uncharacterized protein (DUF952 family)
VRATAATIYKICTQAQWRDAMSEGAFRGAPVDLHDGYIHFSTAAQVVETAAKHFAGQHDLLLIAIDVPSLGDALRWEPSRGGDLFPHLYGTFTPDTVQTVTPLPLGAAGRHAFPHDLA